MTGLHRSINHVEIKCEIFTLNKDYCPQVPRNTSPLLARLNDLKEMATVFADRTVGLAKGSFNENITRNFTNKRFECYNLESTIMSHTKKTFQD